MSEKPVESLKIKNKIHLKKILQVSNHYLDYKLLFLVIEKTESINCSHNILVLQ